MYFPKFSIISFYYNLVPRTNPAMRMVHYILTGVTVVCALTTFVNVTFWCGPNPAVNWFVLSSFDEAYRSADHFVGLMELMHVQYLSLWISCG